MRSFSFALSGLSTPMRIYIGVIVLVVVPRRVDDRRLALDSFNESIELFS